MKKTKGIEDRVYVIIRKLIYIEYWARNPKSFNQISCDKYGDFFIREVRETYEELNTTGGF